MKNNRFLNRNFLLFVCVAISIISFYVSICYLKENNLNFFASSGAIMTLLGLILTIKDTIMFLKIPLERATTIRKVGGVASFAGENTEEDHKETENLRKDQIYGIFLMVTGTIIWAYSSYPYVELILLPIITIFMLRLCREIPLILSIICLIILFYSNLVYAEDLHIDKPLAIGECSKSYMNGQNVDICKDSNGNYKILPASNSYTPTETKYNNVSLKNNEVSDSKKSEQDDRNVHRTVDLRAEDSNKNRIQDISPANESENKNSINDIMPMLRIIIVLGVLVPIVLVIKVIITNKRHRQEKRNREIKEKQIREQIIQLIEQHIDTLARKKRQLYIADGYGVVDKEPWLNEINRFYNRVLKPQVLNQYGADCPDYVIVLVIEELLEKHSTKNTSLKTEFSDAMNPYEYERYCADILCNIGWNAQATKASGDQGCDVIAEKNGTKIVLQCKLYTQPVGNKAVQEVFAAKHHEQANYAAVVTNQSYTRSARQISATTGIELLHHEQLEKWAESILA